MKILAISINSIFLLLLLGVAGLFLAPMLPIQNPVEIRIVESGSMEPAIMTGSLVIISPASSYAPGDVITFKSPSTRVPTTHRIANIEESNGNLVFTTKGDANEEADNTVTSYESIIGKVFVAIPYAGYVLDFARQPIGFALLIGLPAVLIIFGEIEKICVELRKKSKAKKEGARFIPSQIPNVGRTQTEALMMDIANPVVYFREENPDVYRKTIPTPDGKGEMREWIGYVGMFIVSIFIGSVRFTSSTVSYFNDIESSVMNMPQAGALDFNVFAENTTFGLLDAGGGNVDGDFSTVVSPEKGSGDAIYSVRVEKTAGSDLFCSAINVMTGEPVSYEGPILALTASDVLFSDPWTLSTSLSNEVTGYASLDTCVVDIVYTARHVDGTVGAGYFDEERIQKVFYAPQQDIVAPLASFASFITAPLADVGAPTSTQEDTTAEEEVLEVPMEHGAASTSGSEGIVENDVDDVEPAEPEEPVALEEPEEEELEEVDEPEEVEEEPEEEEVPEPEEVQTEDTEVAE